uniref:Uncharacterized protein n=1 Tax=Pseudo-nitzschia delicatissima TaxID=44447 RepID=A0A7S0T830_9STRA|mmetsp:Transcript_1177/g.2669  ORF Transcript_1177/g.2669 Transcript_1177/m.2669 type:complete len:374 (+) Transcript_1177:117-1238(+)
MRSISGNPIGISHRVASKSIRFSPIAVLLLAIPNIGSLVVDALSSSSSFSSSSLSSSDNEPSPWASSSWILELDFGKPTKANKEETPTTSFSNTTPFSSYGKSGSRLVVTCPVVIESQDDANDPDTFVGRGASVIRARSETDQEEDGETYTNNKNDFRYITMEGSKTIEFAPGGWTLRFPPGGKANRGRASKLRFYLDLTQDLERNDVRLPKGSRLYFAASTWREDVYESGLRKVLPLKVSLEAAQQVLDKNLSHETGDRRLDGNDAIETLKAYKDIAGLVLDRDRKRSALQEALDQDGHGYPASEDLPEGPWPGATEWLTLSEANPIYARVPSQDKKNRNMLQQFMGEIQYDYGRVGTWTGEAISSLLLDDE